MNVLITGAEAVNQSAHLMLLAILRRLRRWPDARAAMRPSGRLPRERFAELGLLDRNELPDDWTEIVLDASGDCFGDCWGAAKARTRGIGLPDAERSARRVYFLPQLARVGRAVVQSGRTVAVVTHTVGEDAEPAAHLLRSLPEAHRVEVGLTDPREIKWFLGTCDAVFASRFHALVSALSQAVPAASIGWAHKAGRINTSSCSPPTA